jgi:hypothetical protein
MSVSVSVSAKKRGVLGTELGRAHDPDTDLELVVTQSPLHESCLVLTWYQHGRFIGAEARRRTGELDDVFLQALLHTRPLGHGHDVK